MDRVGGDLASPPGRRRFRSLGFRTRAVLYGPRRLGLFPLLVGIKNTLDAGCFFMLIVVGIVGTVDLAQNGPDFLLP